MLKIIRGDTKYLKFKRVSAVTQEIIKEIPENMYFTVKYADNVDEVLFQKVLGESITYNYDDNYYYLVIESKDTNNLPYGKVVFDIEITNGSDVTTIAGGEIDIESEVTFASNKPTRNINEYSYNGRCAEEIVTFEEYAPTIVEMNMDYNEAQNKPSINEVTLEGNKTLEELGIQPSGDYVLSEDIPSPYDDSEIKKSIENLTKEVDDLTNYDDTKIKQDIQDLQDNKADINDIPNVSNFITKEVDDLTNYVLKEDTGTSINLTIDNSSYVMTFTLNNIDGDVISTKEVDLPLETMIVNAQYDSETKEIVLTLQNGNTTRFSVADLVGGLASTSDIPTKTSQLINDSGFITGYTEADPTVPSYVKSISQTDITNWNNKLSSVPSDYPTTEQMNTAISNAISNSITSVLESDY